MFLSLLSVGALALVSDFTFLFPRDKITNKQRLFFRHATITLSRSEIMIQIRGGRKSCLAKCFVCFNVSTKFDTKCGRSYEKMIYNYSIKLVAAVFEMYLPQIKTHIAWFNVKRLKYRIDCLYFWCNKPIRFEAHLLSLPLSRNHEASPKTITSKHARCHFR